MERDPRWEKVEAYVGPIKLTPDELERNLYPSVKDWVEFRIDLVYDGWRVWNVQRIHQGDIVDMQMIDPYKWILDEMVKMVDDDLDKRPKE